MTSERICTSFNKSENDFHNMDRNLQSILNSSTESVSQIFDAVFAFLARNKPELFSSRGISLEHIVSQSLHKWRTTLQEELTSAHSAVSSPIHKASIPATTVFNDGEKSNDTDMPHSHTIPSSLRKDASCVLADQIQLERAVIDDSNVTSEEIVQTSNNSPGCDAKPFKAYSWSQTMEDVDIKVTVPPQVMKGRQLSVEIQDSSVYVAVRGSAEAVLLHGALRQPVDSAESIWDLTPGRHVTLHLSKREARWWRDSALVGQQGAVEGATEPEREFCSMPEDAQADIRRIVFDAEQKAAGRPTSDALKMESMLRSAWNAPNSPFQGQDFDLNKVNIVPQGQ